MAVEQLNAIAEDLKIKGYKKMDVETLRYAILDEEAVQNAMKAPEKPEKPKRGRPRKENKTVVVSVFVNPTQFNDKNDLKNYPRTPEADAAMLAEAGVDLVLFPSVEEIYPEPDTRQFDFGLIDKVMEGATRPGHFNGVAQVVSRLFDIVKPGKAYFGEKDFQQIAVVKAMVKSLGLGVDIIECPIVRDADGLAMSSRNTLLAADERAIAPNIYKTLSESVAFAKSHSVKETHDFVVAGINSVDGLDVEYYSIVDGDTLLDVKEWDEVSHVVGCITVYCGKTPIRLIDHIKYK